MDGLRHFLQHDIFILYYRLKKKAGIFFFFFFATQNSCSPDHHHEERIEYSRQRPPSQSFNADLVYINHFFFIFIQRHRDILPTLFLLPRTAFIFPVRMHPGETNPNIILTEPSLNK